MSGRVGADLLLDALRTFWSDPEHGGNEMKPRCITAVLITLFATGAAACSSNNSGSPAGATAGPLPFKPSNFDLTGIDLSMITDEDTMSSCEIRTGITSCFNRPPTAPPRSPTGAA